MSVRFEGVARERFLERVPEAAIFPLLPIVDGKCGCGNPKCGRIGKHAAVRWSLVAKGEKTFGDAGHGICTGERSGVFVVESDQKENVDGEANLRALGELPRTLSVRTTSGSLHRYFRMPEGKRVKTCAGELAKGVDVRGDGGIAVIPGSPHRMGGTYRLEVDAPVADAPEWLLALVVEKPAQAGASRKVSSAILSPEEFEALVGALAATDPGAGERNAWRMNVGNLLLTEGHSVEGAQDVAEAVAEMIGGDASEFAAVVHACSVGTGRKAGWNVFRERVGDEMADAVKAALNPGERALEKRIASKLKPKSKASDPLIERLKANVPEVERREQTGEQEITWDAADLGAGDAPSIAKQLHKHLRNIVFAQGVFYQYDSTLGVWTDCLEVIKRHIRSMSLQGHIKLKNEGLESYALKCYGAEIRDDKFFSSAVDGIACPNGFLCVSASGADLVVHDPEHRARVAYPLEYDANADRSVWDAFVLDLFEGDDDQREKVAFMGEFLGASFFGRASRYQKAALARGAGANGKSTLLKGVCGIFPLGRVCSIQPHTMASRFGLVGLPGALLNYVPELKNSYLRETEECKAAIVGDELRGEAKGKDPVPFRPIAGHIFGANHLPASGDASHGFWRRWIVVEFNRKFAVDPLFEAKVCAQKAAIFSWLVEGFVRLLAQGSYTLPPSSEQALKAWKDDACTVSEWLDSGRTSPSDTPCELMTSLYLDYAEWTRDMGGKPVGSKTFGQRMAEKGFERQGTGSRKVPLRLDPARAPVGNVRRALEVEVAKRVGSHPATAGRRPS